MQVHNFYERHHMLHPLQGMPDLKLKCAICGRVSAREHAPKSISECEFDGLPSEEDLQRCNPRVNDLRIRNLGTVHS